MAAKNARIYIAARSEHKSLAAIEDIQASTGNTNIFFLKLDLADLPAVKEAAEEFMGKETELHVLVDNGCVYHIKHLAVGETADKDCLLLEA